MKVVLMADDVSVLIGGKAGDGINSAGMVVAQLLNNLGYHTFMYYDYPSLIRGGHNFAIIRGSQEPILVHRETADYVLALNQETINRHKNRFHTDTVIISNSDTVRDAGQGVSVTGAVKAENALPIMGNSAIIGAFAKVSGIAWEIVQAVFTRHLVKGTDQNLRVARQGYDHVSTLRHIPAVGNIPKSLISGNEAIGLGLIAGGLSAYISYPMTPSSGILHFLAENADRFGITVVHPENEIAVMLMALGFSYSGRRTAVGTSGGGFCLMTEGLSLAGMAELPVVLVVSQRTGPSTGLPTYTAQSDLQFILHAGQGEFPRFVVAPGDAAEAYFWSSAAVDIAWKYQVPAFVLADKTLSEGIYSVDLSSLPLMRNDTEVFPHWDGVPPYRRYAVTESGISPLAFPGMQDAVVKVNSYAHDPAGITTEDPEITSRMAEKRMHKWESLSRGMTTYTTVNVAGTLSAETAVICWGSVRGVCSEVCADLGLRMVQPVVLSPFPLKNLKDGLTGVRRVLVIEENSTGQLAGLLQLHGIGVDSRILHDDGRPLTPDFLKARLQEAMS